MLLNNSHMKTEKTYYFERRPFIGYSQRDTTNTLYMYQLIGSTLADLLSLCEDPLRGLWEIKVNFEGRKIHARRRIDNIKIDIISYNNEKQQ